MRLGWLTAVAAMMVVGACSGPSRTELVVSGASSLTDAFAEIGRAFERVHPDVDVVLNLAGTPTLREQILAGAPVDVFAPANEAAMTDVMTAGLATAPTVFAANRIQLAVPEGNPAAVTGLGDLARPELVVGLCAAPVPCGALARLVLTHAGVTATPDTEEPNARALLTKLAEGEIDAALVFASDVLSAGGAVVGVGTPFEPRFEYPIAVLDGTAHPTEATDFVAFVLSNEGRTILQRHGFTTP